MARAKSRGSLILAANGSGIGLNVFAGDQYVAVVLPSRMFRRESLLDVLVGFIGFKVPTIPPEEQFTDAPAEEEA